VIGLILFIYLLFLQPNTENDDGVTALLSAVAAGSLPCLEVLIEVHGLI
jgi:ankyrin repeat protein